MDLKKTKVVERNLAGTQKRNRNCFVKTWECSAESSANAKASKGYTLHINSVKKSYPLDPSTDL